MKLPHFIRWLFGIDKLNTMDKPLSFPEAIVIVAREQAALGIHEDSQNHGDGIAKYWTATSYPDGYVNREPYCAAFGCWVIKEAMIRFYGDVDHAPFLRPKSARVLDWPAWARKDENEDVWDIKDPDATRVRPGDILLYDFNGPTKSGGTHLAIATSNERVDGTFDTCEGNTNAAGSREGDGVYEKHTRKRTSLFAILRFG